MQLETFYDHSPTEAEKAILLLWPISKEEYLSLATDQPSEYGAIFRLYSLRGEKAKADSYLQRIADPALRLNLTNIDTF